jgi:septal ring factor EnvC (AmiA/AmiB activator)
MRTIQMLLVAILVFPQLARAECKEYKIVEYEDRVEAVCVGEPLTEAQKKAKLEEEKRQELEAQRQRAEDTKRQSEAAAASKAQAEAEAAAERKRQEFKPVTPQLPVNKTITNPQILYK